MTEVELMKKYLLRGTPAAATPTPSAEKVSAPLVLASAPALPMASQAASVPMGPASSTAVPASAALVAVPASAKGPDNAKLRALLAMAQAAADSLGKLAKAELP